MRTSMRIGLRRNQPTEGVPSSERVLTLHDKMRRVCEQKNIRLITVLSPVYAPK